MCTATFPIHITLFTITMSDVIMQKAMDSVKFDNSSFLKSIVPSQLSPDAVSFSPENHLHTLLMCAAAHGAEKCADYLLLSGADPNKKNFTGFSALHWAAYAGRCEVAKKLIEKGANIDCRNEDGQTPFHVASMRGHLEFMRFLEGAGADIHAVTSEGWNALHFALIGNHKRIVQFLLERRVDTHEQAVDGKTVHDTAAEYGRTWFDEMAPSNE